MLAIRTILHPTDFSKHSEHAFRLACLLARDHKAKLILLHVGEPPVTVVSGVMTPAPPSPAEYDRPGLEAKLKAIKPSNANIAIERRLVFGTPSEEIVAAAQQGCDLIVMGTHGRRGLSRVVVGSVAEQVIRKAPCPVFAAKLPTAGEDNARIRRILHPTDFSVRSEIALHLASWLAREYKAPLTVLHVLQPPAVVIGEAIVDVSSEFDAVTAKQRLADLKPTVPVHEFKTDLREGDAADKILEAAKADRSDLIVIGTHGRTGLGRLLMGSVAEQVLRRASCSVLTVKTPLSETCLAEAPAMQTASR